MDIHIEIDKTSNREWDTFVASSPRGHLLQASAWGQLKSAFGWDMSRVTVHAGQELVAGAQVLFRPVPFSTKIRPLYIGYVPKGPLVDFTETSTWTALLVGLDQLCHRQRAILLKIEPDEPQSSVLHQTLLSAGFRHGHHTIQPHSTLLIDLSDGLETCLARMSSKSRYNIRLSERKGITVQVGSEQDVARFHDLAVITGRRDGFAVHSPDYYLKAYRLFNEGGHVHLFLATYEQKLLAGLMAFAFGRKAWYLYGASSDEERQRMPNYALQWAAMTWAHGIGCQTYDLWGIPDDVPALEEGQTDIVQARIVDPPPGSLWGVYRFKRGLGGKTIQYVGAYDRVYSPWLYRLYEHFAARRQGLLP